MQLVSVVLLCVIVAVIAVTDKEHQYAVIYLKKYGYLSQSHDGSDDQKLSNAIIEFQNFAGVEMQGQMDDEMMRIMTMPRCGIADMYVTEDGVRKRRYNLYGTQWSKKDLTFNIYKYSEKIPRNKINSIIQKSFDIWSKYTDLHFTQTTSDAADFQVGFHSRSHGDRNPFDGSGHVLAHAYFPRSGDIHFDEDEAWLAEGGSNGFNLYEVAAHEVGHALGLEHSNIRAAIMTPYYASYNSEFEKNLHQDDIDGIQAIYQKRQEMTERGASEIACGGGNLSGMVVYEGKLYVFKGNGFVVYNRGKVEIGQMATRWQEVPNSPKVFVYRDKIYFLKGGFYWKYIGDKLEVGYPRRMLTGFPGIPTEPDAVTAWRDKIVFFKGNQYWIMDPTTNPRVMPTFPKRINTWGFPRNLDTVLSHPQSNSVYAVKGDKFYIYDDIRRTITEPQSLRKDFFGCP